MTIYVVGWSLQAGKLLVVLTLGFCLRAIAISYKMKVAPQRRAQIPAHVLLLQDVR